MCFLSACSFRCSRWGTRVRPLVSECLSALAIPPLRNLSVPKTMMQKQSCTFVAVTILQCPNSAFLFREECFCLLTTYLRSLELPVCGRVNFCYESKGVSGGGSKHFPCPRHEGIKTSRGTVHLYLMPRLRKSGVEPPFPYVTSWFAQMKTSFALSDYSGSES